MFNEDIIYRTSATRLLELYSFDEILENNDLTEHDVLSLLIKNGMITVPDEEIWDTTEKLEQLEDYEI